jgi:hypothetical protein
MYDTLNNQGTNTSLYLINPFFSTTNEARLDLDAQNGKMGAIYSHFDSVAHIENLTANQATPHYYGQPFRGYKLSRISLT